MAGDVFLFRKCFPIHSKPTFQISKIAVFWICQEDLQNQVAAIRKSKSKAEDALRIEREALQKEKMRLAEESQVGVATWDLIFEFIFPGVGCVAVGGLYNTPVISLWKSPKDIYIYFRPVLLFFVRHL